MFAANRHYSSRRPGCFKPALPLFQSRLWRRAHGCALVSARQSGGIQMNRAFALVWNAAIGNWVVT
ncbi:hypothetical protein DB763_18660, partial [Xanthomonas perforans]